MVTDAFTATGEQIARIGDTDPEIRAASAAHLTHIAAYDVVGREVGQLGHVLTGVHFGLRFSAFGDCPDFVAGADQTD